MFRILNLVLPKIKYIAYGLWNPSTARWVYVCISDSLDVVEALHPPCDAITQPLVESVALQVPQSLVVEPLIYVLSHLQENTSTDQLVVPIKHNKTSNFLNHLTWQVVYLLYSYYLLFTYEFKGMELPVWLSSRWLQKRWT